jgi:CheY-like chemotaxis protein
MGCVGVKQHRKRILLVEDEILIALAEKQELEKRGYEVLAVYSGKKAVEYCSASKCAGIDLILMDINLGKGIDGLEAAETILAERDLPLIFLSSQTEKIIVEKAEKITYYGYVVKNAGITGLDTFIKMAFRLFESKQSEKRFRGLYESMSEGVCENRLVYDDGGTAIDYFVLGANPRYEEILGLNVEDIIGRPATEVYGTDEAPYLETYAKVVEGGGPARFETYYPPLDKYFAISVFSPARGAFATVFTEITGRKKDPSM